MRDFFISYATPDMGWADWIAWELEGAGYEVIMARTDFAPGTNFVQGMQNAVKECRRLLLILSHAASQSKFVNAEWSAYFRMDPDGDGRRLVPVRIDDCEPEGLLAQIVYVDLHQTTEATARDRLLEGVGHAGYGSKGTPAFPGLPGGLVAKPPHYPLNEIKPEAPNVQSRLDPYLMDSSRAFALSSIRARRLGRAFATQHLSDLVKRAFTSIAHLSMLTLDVDGMNNINARYGLGIGDAVIERLFFFCEQPADRVLVGRLGDDSLFLILRDTALANALKFGKKMVRTVAGHGWRALASGLFVHCSIGVAEFTKWEDPFETLLRALEAQKHVRRTDGNGVCAASFLSEKEYLKREAPPKRRVLEDS